MTQHTRREAAAILRTTTKTMGNWAYKGEGPPFRIVGGKALYDSDELAAWLERQPRGGEDIRPDAPVRRPRVA